MHPMFPFSGAGDPRCLQAWSDVRGWAPQQRDFQRNYFYDAGNGLIIFLGEEPWFRIDIYGQAFFQAIGELGIQRNAAGEGCNGPAPPELERSVNSSYSRPHMKEELEKYGVRFSSYGSDKRSGPTIGMALIALAHYEYPDIEVRGGLCSKAVCGASPRNQVRGGLCEWPVRQAPGSSPGQAPSCIGHRSSPRPEPGRRGMEARRVPGQGEFAGRRPACGLLPTGAALWVDRKLSHAADAIGVSDGGGPAAKQAAPSPHDPRRGRGRRPGGP